MLFRSDNWDIQKNEYPDYYGETTHHDIPAIWKAESQNGMYQDSTSENVNSSIFGDNPSDKSTIMTDPQSWSDQYNSFMYSEKFLSKDTPLTMDDLEENAYYAIMSMLFADKDSQFGHAANLTYLSNGDMGVAYDNLGQLHFEFYAPNNHGNLGTTPVSTPSNDKSALQKQADELQNQLTQQQNKVNKDQARVDTDNQTIANDQEQIKKDTPTDLQKQLENDQSLLKNDQNILSNYQYGLEHDKQTIADAQKSLAQDKSVAEEAENSLTAAKMDAVTAKSNLDNANTALTNAQNKLNDLNKQLAKDEAELTNLQKQAAE